MQQHGKKSILFHGSAKLCRKVFEIFGMWHVRRRTYVQRWGCFFHPKLNTQAGQGHSSHSQLQPFTLTIETSDGTGKCGHSLIYS